MARGAEDKAEPDHAVDDDHHLGEHRVARQAGSGLRLRQHQRDDQRHLDDGNGDRQQEGAERLADAVRDDLGVMDRREHAGDQRDAERGEQCRVMQADGRREQRPADQRRKPCPGGSQRRIRHVLLASAQTDPNHFYRHSRVSEPGDIVLSFTPTLALPLKGEGIIATHEITPPPLEGEGWAGGRGEDSLGHFLGGLLASR